MTLQVLRYFVTVASCGNYSQAAKECFISQPALSRAVSGLEEELGCRLFERTTRSLALTEAGALCLREAREILERCERLQSSMAEESRKQQGYLRVGYFSQNYIYQFNKKLLGQREFFYLDTEYDTLARIEEKLCRQELDLILIPEMNRGDIPGLEYAYILRSRLYLLVHETHPLAGRKTVRMKELKDERFIAWDERDTPGVNQAHKEACVKSGFLPVYAASGKKAADIMMLVENHRAAAFIAGGLAEMLPGEFRAVLVEDSERRYGIVCAWLSGQSKEALWRIKTLLAEQTETADL